MKKFILIIILFLATTISMAQIRVGVKGGLNISNLSGLNVNNYETKALVGFHVGGYAAIKLGKLTLQSELLYSTQGAKIDSAGTFNNLKLDYFTIPIMLKYKTFIGLYLETGPVFGFKAGSDLNFNNIEYEAKNADFSWGVGVGLPVIAGLGVGVRYNIGLSKISEGNAFNDPDYKNGVLQISLFYAF